jgi:uncharacterized protein (TIGR03000 family)
MSAANDERHFHTPELAAGQKFYYDAKAVFVKDGKPVEETKRIVVWAGAVVRETFPTVVAAVKDANPTQVAGK